MLISISALVVFVVMALLMASRRLSALLALPLMAVLLSLIGGIPGRDILDEVLAKGAVKLNAAYTTTMFGAMLAELLNRLGVVKSLVRWVAEFAGDNPFVLGSAITLVTALLFSTLGGLGAVIMVGTIILPVMLSIGIPSIAAGALFLFGISLGGMFNIANWQLYMDVLSIPRDQIVAFVLPFALLLSGIITIFLTIELRQRKNILYAIISIALLATGFIFVRLHLQAGAVSSNIHISGRSIWISSASLIVLILYAIHRQLKGVKDNPGFVLFAPLIPLVLVLFAHWDFIPAFMAGILFATLATWQKIHSIL